MKKYEGHTPEPCVIRQMVCPCTVDGFYVVGPANSPPNAYVCYRGDAELYADAPKLLRQRDEAVGLLRKARARLVPLAVRDHLHESIDALLSQLEDENKGSNDGVA